MLLVFVSLSAAHHLHFGDKFCGTDKYTAELRKPKALSNILPANTPREAWKPMRVVMDMSSITTLEDHSDSDSNRSVVLSSSKREILRATFDNIENYLSRLLSVSPETTKINGKDADLYISVSTRPFSKDDKTLAYAWQVGYSSQLGRPNRGGMVVNPNFIPDEPEDENSVDRFFFTVVFHELMHVLGMMSHDWYTWINQTSGDLYTESIVTKFENKTLNKSYQILHTPKVHEWAVQRFGVSEFAPGVPAGIEIEDGGGSGTAGSHPESRIYMSEVICGIFVGRAFISNLSLSVLDDTGWYVVNYTMGEPFPYGDGKSMQMEPLENFPVGPPQLSFPEHYLCWDTTGAPICHHDFTSKGYCSPVTDWDCSSSSADDKAACKMKEFVNPLGLPFRGARSEFDFLYFKVGNMSEMCNDEYWNSLPEASQYGEIYGRDSMCAMSTLSKTQNLTSAMPRCHTMFCDEDDTIAVIVDGETNFCTKKDQTLTFTGYTGHFVCPDPTLLCGMKKFLNLPYYDPNKNMTPTASLFPYTPEPETESYVSDDDTGKVNTSLVVIASLSLVIFAIVVRHFVCRRTNSDDIPEEVNEALNPQSEDQNLEITIPDEGVL